MDQRILIDKVFLLLFVHEKKTSLIFVHEKKTSLTFTPSNRLPQYHAIRPIRVISLPNSDAFISPRPVKIECRVVMIRHLQKQRHSAPVRRKMFRPLEQFPSNAQPSLFRCNAHGQDLRLIGRHASQYKPLFLGNQPEHSRQADLCREHFGTPSIARRKALPVHFRQTARMFRGGADHFHGGETGAGRSPPAGNLASGGST